MADDERLQELVERMLQPGRALPPGSYAEVDEYGIVQVFRPDGSFVAEMTQALWDHFQKVNSR